MGNRSALARVAAALLVVAPLLACKMGKKEPEAGKECDTAGAQVCKGPAATLVCQGGMWREFPCNGPKGCAKTGEASATCDLSGNAPGTPCPESNEGNKSCADKKALIECSGAKLTRVDCKGSKGCYVEGSETKCDMSIADSGTPCVKEAAWACSVDQKQQLLCKNGEWITNAPCRGAKGCSLKEDNKIWCDQTVAYVGDTCFNDDQRACTHDNKNMLACKNGKFSFDTRCNASPFCTIKDNRVNCTHW